MSDTSKVLETVNGVAITEEMVRLFSKRFAEENVPSNQPGFIATIAGWINGGSMDSYLTDSVETREIFHEVRMANFKANGIDPEKTAYSNVTFNEGCEKGRAEKELIEKTRKDKEAEEAAKAAEGQEKASE